MPTQHGKPFSVTHTHATAAAAEKAAATNKIHYITDVGASSDKAGAIMIVYDGSTALWQMQVAANTSVHHTFKTPLAGSKGAAVSVAIDGTSACKANISGFTVHRP